MLHPLCIGGISIARLVKCQITGEKGKSDEFYKASNGKYYKTKELYDDWRLQVVNRQACTDALMELLGYKPGMKFPTVTSKFISEYEVYGFDVLLATIQDQSKSIQWALQNKDFRSAILQNNVFSNYKKKVAEKREAEIISRREVEYEDLDIQRSKQTTKDISKWLEED